MFWLELAVVLAAIVVGSRMGGFGLGIMGGLGLTILTFVFGVRPTSPPIDVILMIIAVVCAAGALQAAGGLDYLVTLAARILRSHPAYVTFLAPIVTFFFTLFAGTAHMAYSVLPVISEVARGTGTRPERPLSIAVIAASMGISASPVTAVTMSFLALVAPLGVNLANILMVSIPAHFLGIMLGAMVASRMGKDLDKDEAYLERVAAGLSPAVADPQKLDALLSTDVPFSAKFSVLLFLLGAVTIVLLGSFPSLRPVWESAGKQVRMNMPVTIQMVMLSIAAIILLATRVKPSKAVSGGVFSAGIQAVVAIFGIAWMGDSFFAANMDMLSGGIKTMLNNAPWTFAIALFALSTLLYSQAATTRALMPLGVALGLPATSLIAMLPAVNGIFFIPNYPTVLAAINLDRTGSTGIGKYVLNHSFMLPGLTAIISSVAIGFGLVQILF